MASNPKFRTALGSVGRLARNRRFQYGCVAVLAVGFCAYTVRVWMQVSRTLKQGVFASSSNLYAAPRMVVQGDALNPDQLITELRESGYSEAPQNPLGYFKAGDGAIEIHPGEQSYFRPEAALLKFSGTKLARIKMLDNGENVNEYFLEPHLITSVDGGSREKRRLVTYNKIPQVLVNAVLSAEDKRFFSHWGFDPLRIAKALYVDVRSGRKEQGGSTLTMQLSRMLWLDQNKNWARKATEFLITLILEVRLSKQEIFEHYANEIYLGEHSTYAIHGFGQAASVYFHKEIENLTLPEAALLAGLIQRPSYLQPFQHPERAISRRNLILGMMRQNGFIGDVQLEAALQDKLTLNPVPADYGDAPYFVALALDELNARIPPPAENQPPVPRRIYTTMDADLQRIAVEAVQEQMPNVDQQLIAKYGKEARNWGPPQVALLALDPKTGEVKAAVGGRNYVTSQLNHLLSKRQPGSVFKPFVYAAALHNRVYRREGPITQASTLQDEPHKFWFHHESYEPTNFGDNYFGEVTLRRALAHSLNVATVELAEEVGYNKVADLAWNAGLNKEIQPTPSMALGSYETTPIEIGGAYTVFANRGIYTKPRFISSIREMQTGKQVVRDAPEQHRVLDERVNYLMVDMLQEVVNSGTAAGVRGMGFYAPAAGKTGTSRDGWFAGFTSELLVVVWVGFDDNRELNLEGARSALPIWTAFMRKAAERSRYVPHELSSRPDGLVQVEIDAETGKLAGPACTVKAWAYFLQGQEPKEECPGHETDPATGEPVSELAQPLALPITKEIVSHATH